MVNDVVLSSALRNTLNSINRAQATLDNTSLRLATGKRINSAIDNPNNFFLSEALDNRANDFNRLMDGIGQSIRTIQEGLLGLEALERFIKQAETIADESLKKAQNGEVDLKIQAITVDASPTPLSQQILADTPDVYFRLNDAGNPAADSGFGGGVNATYLGGVALGSAPLYPNGSSPSADFDGINDAISVTNSGLINTGNHAQRTVELTFNADTVAGRQMLYEEGGGTNSFSIYIDNGNLYTVGRDQGAWGPNNFSAPVLAGQTYHVAFVFDQPSNSFTGYLDGVSFGSTTVANTVFPSHTGNVNIGRSGGAWFHDGNGGAGFYFDGRISDVAIHNTALSAARIASHANSLNSSTRLKYVNTDFEKIVAQIDANTIDANYRGVNLLAGENLRTDFNEERTNYLITEGIDFTTIGLDISRLEFDSAESMEIIRDSARDALQKVRNYATTLTNNISIIESRSRFSEQLVTALQAGASELTIADLDKEGANLLAGQTRIALGFTALSLAGRSQASILDVVSGNA